MRQDTDFIMSLHCSLLLKLLGPLKFCDLVLGNHRHMGPWRSGGGANGGQSSHQDGH